MKDGGPYFDAGVVVARDPENGIRNASIQRFMVWDEKTLHVNIDSGRHLELYLDKATTKGQSLPFTLNVGVGPGLHFAAATPAEAAPPDTDELGIASEFHGAPLELVRGDNSDVELVAHAMYALECEMKPGELGEEGPFAEVTGYYAKRAPRPVVHVKKIHRRHKPVFQTILSGKEVWNSVGLLGEANVLALVSRQVPGVKDVYFTHGGCGFYHAVVAIAQKRAGWAKQAIMATFAAFPPLKMVDGGRRRRRYPQRLRRRMGDGHAPRPGARHHGDRQGLRARAQPELPRTISAPRSGSMPAAPSRTATTRTARSTSRSAWPGSISACLSCARRAPRPRQNRLRRTRRSSWRQRRPGDVGNARGTRT